MFEITLKFLEAVAKNNSTEWLHTYRDLYQQEKKRFSDFVGSLLIEFQKLNPDLEGQTPKDCIYRFNKDIRFSKDKKPYKENFWANFCVGWKKAWAPCFYFHLQPGNKSFVTWWVYYPSQENEDRVRIHIIKNFDERAKLATDKKMLKYFTIDEADHKYKTNSRILKVEWKYWISKDVKQIFRSYLIQETDGNWKPLYNPYEPNRIFTWNEIMNFIAYNKDWTFTHSLSDKDVSSPKLYDELLKAYKLINPIIRFLDDAYFKEEYKSK